MNDINNLRSHQSDEEDLKLIRRMKQYADDGFDVELRKDRGGGYKVFKVKKKIIKAD